MFFIIDRKVVPVVGREWLRKLNLESEVGTINKDEDDILEKEFKEKLQKFLEENKEKFTEETAEMKNCDAAFKLKDNIVPVYLKPRAISFALKHQVEVELDRLLRESIIEKVSYSKWVPVMKQNGKI